MRETHTRTAGAWPLTRPVFVTTYEHSPITGCLKAERLQDAPAAAIDLHA